MKDLTILVTGSGNSSTANIEDVLTDWIFQGKDSRNVRVIIPFTDDLGKGIQNFINWGKDFFAWGESDGDPLVAVVQGDHGHRIISKADETKNAGMRFPDTIDTALDILSDAGNDGNDVAFISLFEPNNTTDLQAVTIAKTHYAPIPTFNLCEGMVDYFEGYESAEDRTARETAVEAFQEKLRNGEAEVDTKPATKKAPAPRKRAAKKTVAPPAKPVAVEPEKPLQDVPETKHVHHFVYADDGIGHEGSVCYDCGTMEDVPVGTLVEVAGLEFTKKGPNPFRDPLPGNPLYDQNTRKAEFATQTIPGLPDGHQETNGNLLVSKSDLVQLGEAMKKMAEGFTEAISTLTKIVSK